MLHAHALYDKSYFLGSLNAVLLKYKQIDHDYDVAGSQLLQNNLVFITSKVSGCCGCFLQVLFKLGKDGHGEEVQLQDLPLIGNPSFAGFTHEMFTEVRCPLNHW